MNRQRFCFAGGILLLIAGAAQAAVYDNVYWIGGSGDWTGDVTATPEYATGHWSNDPGAASGQPAKFVLGRNDGIRVGQVVGAGGIALERAPCPNPASCSGGTQLGTDIYITSGATVSYNPNDQIITGIDGAQRFGDWRIQPDANFIGTPTVNLSNGSKIVIQTTSGGDIDGMWTRFNGAELNLDGAGTTFSRIGDAPNGFASGAFMFHSYHGYNNQVQTQHITNGALFENQGQVWYGISGDQLNEETKPGIRLVTTINNGDMDLSGGDEYALDNDNFLTRGDLAFIYNFTYDADPSNDEKYVINFTGPGSITVDGKIEEPIDYLDGTYTQAELDAEFGDGRGGIRIAHQVNDGSVNQDSDYGNDRNIQRSYQDLWDAGILRSNNKSGLTGHVMDDYFDVENSPGDDNYKLISTIAASPIPIRGDFNRDGKVDQADYVVYAKTVGADGYDDTATDQALLLADADGSLHVDANDYRIWKEMFGTGTAGGGGSGAIPEPGTMLLMVIGLGGVSLFRKRAS